MHDRDFNALVNLENWGMKTLLAVSSTESINACGEEGSGSDLGLGETGLSEAGIRQEIVKASNFCKF